MFLKLRNWVALLLVLLASFGWSVGSTILDTAQQISFYPSVTETIISEETQDATEGDSYWETTPWQAPFDTVVRGYITNHLEGSRRAGILFRFLALALGLTAVFVFYPRKQFLGPDGAMLLAACFFLIIAGTWDFLRNDLGIYSPYISINAKIIFCTVQNGLILLGLWEMFGWIKKDCPLSETLLLRVVCRIRKQQGAVTLLCLWMVFLSCFSLTAWNSQMPWTALLLTITFFLGMACLWQYGSQLQHFKLQLERFRQGSDVEVRSGVMEDAEQQLLAIQKEHRQAVQSAIANERFKVELISNVSHDLRTPLTAILGYGELLQKQSLSQEGTEQLARLNQKAGYMRDLVDSLFELTKISSGLLDAKMEEIDLIRLLEQTIGLLDDQLAIAGLTVKRHYSADSILITTDGNRMHQVFDNLLGNAIKYAMPGTRIYLKVKETDSAYVVRWVNTASYEMDFAPEEITQRFVRGDKARSTKGSGLGLAIAQTYTESVGGTFAVTVDGDQFSAVVTLPKTERNL